MSEVPLIIASMDNVSELLPYTQRCNMLLHCFPNSKWRSLFISLTTISVGALVITKFCWGSILNFWRLVKCLPENMPMYWTLRGLYRNFTLFSRKIRDESEDFCYRLMEKTSRSFAAVTLELKPDLDKTIRIFYLILRAVDSIEDTTSLSIEQRANGLTELTEKLDVPGWNSKVGFSAIPDFHLENALPHEVELLEGFDHVIKVFQSFRKEYRDIIKKYVKIMSGGMAHYLDHEIVSLQDYYDYCYYAAGVLGVGLTELFVESKFEQLNIESSTKKAIAMGLFLQKTNIIRDYYEDVTQVVPRVFYPKDVWSKYVENIKDLSLPCNSVAGVHCLNELITDALEGIFECLDYLSLLQEVSIFRFCAIPQCMAIATLEACYQNPEVLNSRVKVTRYVTMWIVGKCQTFADALAIYAFFLSKLLAKIDINDPNAKRTAGVVGVALAQVYSYNRKKGTVNMGC